MSEARRQNRALKWLLLLAVLLIAATAAVAVILPRNPATAPQPDAASTPEPPLGVGCPGRIEPEDGVLAVAAPYFSGQPSVIRELRVKQGDHVKAGQVVAVLDGWSSLAGSLREQESAVNVERAKLAQVKAGVKQADIDGQKMDIARWQSEYETAETDNRRAVMLHENGILNDADLDQKRLAVDRAKRTLDSAKERLKSLEEVRKEDVALQEAELAKAISQVERAKVDLERMVVRAPADGRVLKIQTHPGEEAGSHGVLELAKTERMYVIAEVYETDIARVRLGQKAVISGALLPEPVTGNVSQIDSQVMKSELLPADPSVYADKRIVKVKILVPETERIAQLIYGRVDVVIQAPGK